MVLCCALPLLIAGGALAGVGGVLGSPWVISAGLVVVAVAVIASLRRRRRNDVQGCCPPTPQTGADQGDETKEEKDR
ncbi:hypothetical protein [Kocuria sp. TGY1127_2]